MTDADEVLRRIANAIEMSLEDTPEEVPTVEEAIAEFLASLEAKGRSASTLKSYRTRLAIFASQYGHMPIGDVKASHVDQWVIDMRRQKKRWKDHPTRKTRDGGLSPATINGRIQSVKALFRWAGGRGYLERDPAADLKQLPRYDTSSRAMHPNDLLAMIRVAAGKAEDGNWRDLALILFLADTGCRVGEAVTLTISRLNLSENEATVDGKTGKRVVDFTATAARALGQWLDMRPDHRDHDFVFTTIGPRYGRPMSPRSVYAMMQRMAIDAGIERRYNPHAIRHLVGQTFTDEGNLELARKKLGHSSIATTALHYGNQDRDRVKRATERLSITGLLREDEGTSEGNESP